MNDARIVNKSQNSMTFLLSEKVIETSYRQWLCPANLSSMSELFEKLEQYWQSLAFDNATDLDKNTVKLLLEEIFVNIVHYGNCKDSEVKISLALCQADPALHLVLQLEDTGNAFNPLLDAPETTLGLSSEQAPIGGLGVHLIKSMSIKQKYQRNNHRNQLCLLLAL